MFLKLFWGFLKGQPASPVRKYGDLCITQHIKDLEHVLILVVVVMPSVKTKGNRVCHIHSFVFLACQFLDVGLATIFHEGSLAICRGMGTVILSL